MIFALILSDGGIWFNVLLLWTPDTRPPQYIFQLLSVIKLLSLRSRPCYVAFHFFLSHLTVLLLTSKWSGESLQKCTSLTWHPALIWSIILCFSSVACCLSAFAKAFSSMFFSFRCCTRTSNCASRSSFFFRHFDAATLFFNFFLSRLTISWTSKSIGGNGKIPKFIWFPVCMYALCWFWLLLSISWLCCFTKGLLTIVAGWWRSVAGWWRSYTGAFIVLYCFFCVFMFPNGMFVSKTVSLLCIWLYPWCLYCKWTVFVRELIGASWNGLLPSELITGNKLSESCVSGTSCSGSMREDWKLSISSVKQLFEWSSDLWLKLDCGKMDSKAWFVSVMNWRSCAEIKGEIAFFDWECSELDTTVTVEEEQFALVK